MPRASLICPKTGSTVSLRWEYTSFPSVFQLGCHPFPNRGSGNNGLHRQNWWSAPLLPARSDIRLDLLVFNIGHIVFAEVAGIRAQLLRVRPSRFTFICSISG